MPLPSFHDIAPLSDLSALCAAIIASPAIRDLLAPRNTLAIRSPEIPGGVTCGEIIAAIYDLVEGNYFEPQRIAAADPGPAQHLPSVE